MHVDILRVLAHWGPLKLTHVMHKGNFNSSILREYIDLLTEQGLVEKKILKRDRIVYAITLRGFTVLKQFREFTEGCPMIEKAGNQKSQNF